MGFQAGQLGGRREGMPVEAPPASRSSLPLEAPTPGGWVALETAAFRGRREGKRRVIYQPETWRAWQIRAAV